MADGLFYIVCTRHSFGGRVVLWAPERCGYRTDLGQAGKYSQEEAVEITRSTRGTDFAVPCDVLDSLETTIRYIDKDHESELSRAYAAPFRKGFKAVR